MQKLSGVILYRYGYFKNRERNLTRNLDFRSSEDTLRPKIKVSPEVSLTALEYIRKVVICDQNLSVRNACEENKESEGKLPGTNYIRVSKKYKGRSVVVYFR